MENSPENLPQAPVAPPAPTVTSLQEAMMTHLLAENAFLRAQVEQHARAEAELRAALRETMRAMPKAFTTGQGEDKEEKTKARATETDPPVDNVAAQIEQRIAQSSPAISPMSDAQPISTPAAKEIPKPVEEIPVPLAPAPVIIEPVEAAPIAKEPLPPQPIVITPAAVRPAPIIATPVITAPVELPSTPVASTPAPPMQKAEIAPVSAPIAKESPAVNEEIVEKPRPESRPIVKPPLARDEVYEPYHQPGQPVALQSAIHELSRRRVSRPLWKKVLGMR